MIPISPLAMLLGLALLSAGALSLVGLVALGLSLLVPAWRARLRRRWKTWSLLAALLLLLATPAAWMSCYLYEQQREDDASRQAHNPRLEEELLLGEITFPAGTQVRLQRAVPGQHWHSGEALPYGLQTLDRAQFEAPVSIRGLDVERLEAPALRYFTALRLARDQVIDSWPCAAGHDVEFRREPEDRLRPSAWRFQSCTLQADALLVDIVWPQGSRVFASENGWVLQVPGATEPAVDYRGMRLNGLRVGLGEDVQLQYWDAELAGSTRFGTMRYDSGTRVWGFANGDLRFTPEENGALDDNGERPPAEHSVFQTADGELIAIRSNQAAGIIRWMKLSTP